MTEHEKRLKRLTIRSWRRGTKEMDLILGRFWDANGKTLEPEVLDMYEAILAENDQDLYAWVSGQVEPPAEFEPMIELLRT